MSDSSTVSNLAVVARCPTSSGHLSSPRPRVASSTNVADSGRTFAAICVEPCQLLSGHGFCEARGGDWGNREDTMRLDYDIQGKR